MVRKYIASVWVGELFWKPVSFAFRLYVVEDHCPLLCLVRETGPEEIWFLI